jgi:hypothetical protein
MAKSANYIVRVIYLNFLREVCEWFNFQRCVKGGACTPRRLFDWKFEYGGDHDDFIELKAIPLDKTIIRPLVIPWPL